MQTSLKANLLKHLIAKKEDGGFTLIELLVVIIIIGILSAIALPAFLNQANRARQSEAVTYVGSMNRAQQAFYLERSRFTEGIADLGLGIPTNTDNYIYDIDVQPATGNAPTYASNQAKPAEVNDQGETVESANSPVRAYVGGVSVAEVNVQEVDGERISETTTVATLCEAAFPPVNQGPDGTQIITVDADGVPGCPAGADRAAYNRKS